MTSNAQKTTSGNSNLWDFKITPDGHADHKKPTWPILFIFLTAFVGAIFRVILMNSRWKPVREFPYTVFMTIIGLLAGLLEFYLPATEIAFKAAHLNAHAILTIFLPCLIFSSAFEMEMHIFYRSIVQVLMLAGPGTLISTGLTALMICLIFEWNTLCALLFGCIVSATDPVAVVSILHSCGAPARLGVLIDGEALINDGAAIVLFTIFSNYQEKKNFAGFLYFCMVIFLSPIIGFVSGILVKFCVGACYNDFITETIITISVPFIIYIVAENLCNVSGVLTVLVFGLTLSHFKTSFSPKVFPILMHTWEYITFLANTLIFFIVGVVIVKEIKDMEPNRAGKVVGETLVSYILVVAIRLVVIILLYPILRRTGYGINWKTALVMLWGGLRGAVGLALALVVVEYSEENKYWHLANHGVEKGRHEQIMVWTIGIVFCTLVINATTTSSLLKVLGFGKASIAKKINMAAAMKKIEESIHYKMSVLTSDKFLAGANWQQVQQIVSFDNMYEDESDDDDHDDIFLERKTTCPDCNSKVPNNPSANETRDMIEESRHRLLRLEGVSYLTQYEDGRILQKTTHELHSRTEELAEVDEAYTNIDAVVHEHVISNNLYAKRGVKIRRRRKMTMKEKNKNKHAVQMSEIVLEREIEDESDYLAVSVKSSTSSAAKAETTTTTCKQRREKLAKVVDGIAFEVFFMVVILANMVNIIYEVSQQNTCQNVWLFCVDWGFLTLYLIEFGLRLGGHGKDYFPRSFWGLADFVIIVMGLVSSMSVIIESAFEGTEECNLQKEENVESGRRSNIMSVIKFLKIARLLRIIRITRFFMSEDSTWVQKIIDSSYNAVMEVNVAMITAQDDIKSNIHQVPISVYKPINDVTTSRIQANRFVSKSKFAKLCMERPGVEVSLKTRQATAVIVDSAIQRVSELFEMGFLEDKDMEVLLDILELKKINLVKCPTSLPVPDAAHALKIVPWLDEDEDAQMFVTEHGHLQELPKGHNLNHRGEYRGVFIIVRGTVLIKGVRGLARLHADTMLSDSTQDIDRLPDMYGRWSDALPRRLLAKLSKPKGVMSAVGHGSVDVEETRDELLNARFSFVSKGYVVNEIHALVPSFTSTVPAICQSDVLAYFISKEKMAEMIRTFSCRFLSLEGSIWLKLTSTYLSEEKRDLSDWQNLDQAFVIFIDGNHKLKSSGGKVEFQMDYANMQHALLLQGTAKSSAVEDTVVGPYEMHHGEMSLEFASPSRADQVVGVIYVIPNSGNDVHEVFSADLDTIREYAAEWIRTRGFEGSMDELLLRSVDHFDNSGGADEDSTLYIAIKNRIDQVIAATLAVTGEKLTVEEVILGQNVPIPIKTKGSSKAGVKDKTSSFM